MRGRYEHDSPSTDSFRSRPLGAGRRDLHRCGRLCLAHLGDRPKDAVARWGVQRLAGPTSFGRN